MSGRLRGCGLSLILSRIFCAHCFFQFSMFSLLAREKVPQSIELFFVLEPNELPDLCQWSRSGDSFWDFYGSLLRWYLRPSLMGQQNGHHNARSYACRSRHWSICHRRRITKVLPSEACEKPACDGHPNDGNWLGHCRRCLLFLLLFFDVYPVFKWCSYFQACFAPCFLG